MAVSSTQYGDIVQRMPSVRLITTTFRSHLAPTVSTDKKIRAETACCLKPEYCRNMQNSLSHHSEEFPDELVPDTLLLHGQYQIESYLIRGGFGITYLARDSLDRRVVIKECFPNSICCRIDGLVQAKSREQQDQLATLLRHFLREARRLARLSHPNIVGVHQVFEENNTAYMALDYVDGMDLLSVVEEFPQRLTPDTIRSMLIKSLGAIKYIHDKGILHRDISPDNILLDKAENLTLIDFGAAREQASRESRALSSLLAVKDGYSPQEFYLRNVTQHPSSDLYSLGATFYHLMTGAAPPDSQQRLAAVAADAMDPFVPLSTYTADFEPDFVKAINKVLKLFPEDRFQSAQEWVEAIDPERRRQAALVSASGDKSIRLKVSQLVAETNQNLGSKASSQDYSPDQPEDAPMAAPPVRIAPVEQDKPSSSPVDIFGEPIEDVEAWLWAQDRVANTKPPREMRRPQKKTRLLRTQTLAAAAQTHQQTSQKKPHEPQRPTLLKSLMGRLTTAGIYPSKTP